MGHKHDQSYTAPVHRPSQGGTHPVPPPLPPRDPSTSQLDVPPPPYTELPRTYHSQPVTSSWAEQDPRSSSTQSLVPQDSTSHSNKRRLLLIYIHGFMGNETSFQSFPAHVHNALTEKLSQSHVVHTKIYPRYKTRKRVEEVREGFSDWLGPHEAPDTDIILLGHSMGGILSAEACLMAPYVAGTARSFRHRILGTINFDTPFLGMHPGVIASGLGSLFRPAADSPAPTPPTSSAMSQLQRPDSLDQASSASYFDQNESISPTLLPTDAPPSSTYSPLSPLSSLPSNDPNYNPSFPNDVNLPQRKGWSSVAHFINKHSDGLAAATKSYVTSHLEFGGALADYNALKVRYSQIRRLEDLNGPDRVRFVNYYTASTGRPKKPKDVRPESDRGEGTDSGLSPGMADIERPSKSPSPKISVQDTEGESRSVEADGIERLNLNEDSISDVNHMFSNQAQRVGCLGSAQTEDSIVGDSDTTIKPFEADAPLRAVSPSPSSVAESTISPSQTQTTLPPIPDLPPEPGPFTCEYEDKGMRRIAEQQHQREIKAYQRTVKDREKALKDRRKFHEKRERDVAKRREKETRKEEKERLKVEKDEAKRAAKDLSKTRKAPGYVSPRLGASLNPTLDAVTEDLKDKANKKPRDKKFCLLPSKVNGELDHCWVRVFMPGVDEVGAHCGLFVVDGERYEWFVCDVSQRISDWVRAA